jgi:hypothetical protein
MMMSRRWEEGRHVFFLEDKGSGALAADPRVTVGNLGSIGQYFLECHKAFLGP